jgi:peptidoglycan/LPS O-acetylase OafA/YrhL
MPSAANILAIVTFTRTYLPLGTNIFDDALPIGHFWSLNVEEHSYIFLAIIAALTRRFKNDWLTVGLLFAASLVTLAFSYWYFNHPPSSGSPADVRTESASLALLASVAVAYAKYRFPLSIYQKVPTALPIAAIGASFLCFSTIHFGTQQYLSPLLLALSINFFDRAPAFAKAALSNSILRWFGVCSFSLYLWQQPFLALEKLGGNGPLMLCAAVAVGGVSFYYFENPVRIWLTAAWNKRAMTHNTLANDPLTSDGPLALIDGSLKK